MTDTAKVLVFGATGLDTLAQASLQTHESVPGRIVSAAGGVAGNLAMNLARLDVPVLLASRIGDDSDGRRVMRELEDSGVSTECLQTVADAKTARYVAVLDRQGDLQLAVSDMDIIETFGGDDIRALEESIRAASAIVVDTNLSARALSAVLASESDALRFADSVSAAKAVRLRGSLSRLDVLKTTPAEAAALTSIDSSDPVALSDALLELGVGSVYLSLGGDGLFIATRHGSTRLPAVDAGPVCSTSGAGDALLAGIILGRLLGEDEVEAGRLGLEAAALTLTSDKSSTPMLSRGRLIHERSQRAANA